MRYCYNCNRITLGNPRFCNFCGRSYDDRLCPRLHPNPRHAVVCSHCGSRDLTTPQPQSYFRLRVIVSIVLALPGILLIILSAVFLIVDVYVLFARPSLQLPSMLCGLLLGLSWLLYINAAERSKRRAHSKPSSKAAS